MSTAEAVGVATSLGGSKPRTFAGLATADDVLALLPGYLLGVVRKDDPRDQAHLLGYWDAVVKRRARSRASSFWTRLWELRSAIERGRPPQRHGSARGARTWPPGDSRS